ncbi:endospore germination permease [Paenibacillus sp. ISL-20]|uniref:GerAB/ArcD/ProY family transporter n=1 Tax=Paenibacillus sp. ISL-20 TaxID=2819163 RepID=UPI001BE51DD0|nr:endospore germination permease [Paenibacillus sp. ISL-20]MBT2760313.1 endospore germination permease [Paenibacillus sp. ISL-20]
MNTIKISNNQVFWITLSVMSMTLFSTQSLVIQTSKQDAWMSFLIGGAIACGITLLSRALSLLYPEQTLGEFSRTILGRFLGKVVVVPFLVAWILISSTLLRRFSDFFQMILFDRTPTSVLMLLMMAIVVMLVSTGGIESIGRCSQLLGPLILAIIVAVACLSYNNFEFEQILPVFTDSGVEALLRGSLAPVTVLGDTVFLLMVTKFMENPRQGTKSAVLGVAVGSVISSMLTLMTLSIFGSGLSSKMLFPTFEMMRFVSLMEFIQNIEIFSSVVWFFSVFIKLSLYLFAASYGMSQWLGLKRWTLSIWAIAPMVYLIAWKLPQESLSDAQNQLELGIHYLIPIVLIGLPLMLWTIGIMRKRQSSL